MELGCGYCWASECYTMSMCNEMNSTGHDWLNSLLGAGWHLFLLFPSLVCSAATHCLCPALLNRSLIDQDLLIRPFTNQSTNRPHITIY